MTELVTNGTFDSDLTGWSEHGGTSWEHDAVEGYSAAGSAHFPGALSEEVLYQQITTPAGDDQEWYLSFAVKGDLDDNSYLSAFLNSDYTIPTSGGPLHMDIYVDAADVWQIVVIKRLMLPANTSFYLGFACAVNTHEFWVDDVHLGDEPLETGTWTPPTANSCEDLRWRLQRARLDPAANKHAIAEYNAAINRAISNAPEGLWIVEVDTSLTTDSESREYDLSTLTDLEHHHQVRNVYIETGTADLYGQVTRWRVEQDGTNLTLYLDESPPDDRTLKVEYIRPHNVLDCTTTTATELDADWIVYKALIYLLIEAQARELDDPAQLALDLQYYGQLLTAREAVLLGQQPLPIKRARPSNRYRRA